MTFYECEVDHLYRVDFHSSHISFVFLVKTINTEQDGISGRDIWNSEHDVSGDIFSKDNTVHDWVANISELDKDPHNLFEITKEINPEYWL